MPLVLGATGTEISNNSDMNSFVSPGVYISPSQAVSVTLENLPDGFRFAFYMRTIPLPFPPNFIGQILFGLNGAIYKRVRDNGVWKSWVKIAD